MIPRLPRSTRMRIYSVNLSFSPVGDHQFIYLRPLERLRFLILNKTRFRGHGLRQLRHLKHLWRINLNYSRIDDRGLRALARFPALRHLELRYCKAVTFRGLQALGASKTLRILHFQQNSHIAQSDREICRAIPSLRYVSRFYRLRCR